MYVPLISDYFDAIPTAPPVHDGVGKQRTPMRTPVYHPSMDAYIWSIIQSYPLPDTTYLWRKWIAMVVQRVKTQLDVTTVSLSFFVQRSLECRPLYTCVLVHFVDFHNVVNTTPFYNWIRRARKQHREFSDYCEYVWIQSTANQKQMDFNMAYDLTSLEHRTKMLNVLKEQKFIGSCQELLSTLTRHHDEQTRESELSVMNVYLLPKLIAWTAADRDTVTRLVKLCNRSKWYITLTNILNAVQSVFSEEQIRHWRQDPLPTCHSCWMPMLMKLKCVSV